MWAMENQTIGRLITAMIILDIVILVIILIVQDYIDDNYCAICHVHGIYCAKL